MGEEREEEEQEQQGEEDKKAEKGMPSTCCFVIGMSTYGAGREVGPHAGGARQIFA